MSALKAQDTIPIKRRADSLYVEKFDDWFVIKPSIINTAEALLANTRNFNIVLQPNT